MYLHLTFFDYLETQEAGKGGEIQLTDAIQRMNIDRSIYAYEFEGERYDAGEKLDFIFTTLAFALKDEELKAPLLTKFKELYQQRRTKRKNCCTNWKITFIYTPFFYFFLKKGAFFLRKWNV